MSQHAYRHVRITYISIKQHKEVGIFIHDKYCKEMYSNYYDAIIITVSSVYLIAGDTHGSPYVQLGIVQSLHRVD